MENVLIFQTSVFKFGGLRAWKTETNIVNISKKYAVFKISHRHGVLIPL